MITAVLVCAFIIFYRANIEPPIYDVISPLVSLSILATSLTLSKELILLIIGLALEILADFYMNKDSLVLPIIFFSVGHLLRQLSFLYPMVTGSMMIIPTITGFLVITLLFQFLRIRKGNSIIVCYSLIILLSAVHVSLVREALSYGYVVFILSDIIIGYDLMIRRIYPRWFRVIVVPLLYWGSQYLLSHEFLSLIPSH